MCALVSCWRGRKVFKGWLLTLSPHHLQGPQRKCRAATMADSLCLEKRGGCRVFEGVLEGFILVMVIGLLVWKWDHSRKPHSGWLPPIYLSGRLRGGRGEGKGEGWREGVKERHCRHIFIQRLEKVSESVQPDMNDTLFHSLKQCLGSYPLAIPLLTPEGER